MISFFCNITFIGGFFFALAISSPSKICGAERSKRKLDVSPDTARKKKPRNKIADDQVGFPGSLSLIDMVTAIQKNEITDLVAWLRQQDDDRLREIFLSRTDFLSWGLLHWIAHYSSEANAQILIDLIPIQLFVEALQIQDKALCTPIHVAAKGIRRREIIRIMLSKVPNLERINVVKILNKDQQTVLFYAVQSNQYDLVEMLFELLPQVHRQEMVAIPCKKVTPYERAVQFNYVEVAALLAANSLMK